MQKKTKQPKQLMLFEGPQKQLMLFKYPFRKKARTIEDFLMNIIILSDQGGGEFDVEINQSNYDKFITAALDAGALVKMRTLCEQFYSVLEQMDVCCEVPGCKNPVIWHYNCSCGEYSQCEEHFDVSLFYNHADHECDPDCCMIGHTAEKKTWEEIKSMASPIEISVTEEAKRKNIHVFFVSVKPKTKKDYYDELAWIAGNYRVIMDEQESADLRREAGDSIADRINGC